MTKLQVIAIIVTIIAIILWIAVGINHIMTVPPGG